ncbi:hypothetical protein CWB72_09360 [Pseudoalteromonas phenolica]|uniref:hypothetical protein n=1 Tax=Pseudoalteromonas phenolica TaxID=161398 RepID=UPI00110B9F94|nr:hypothetical protein [Pseudoalteromonas phenolica]TMN90124.1 hypothetical protein CWB72_09360 [Pseudoalteromonas phenolica]
MPAFTRVVQLSVSNHQKSQFSKAAKAKKAIDNYLKESRNSVPRNIAESAYDLVGASYVRSDVAQHYVNNQTIRDYVANYTSAAVSVVTKLLDIKWTVELKFSDGSVATFVLGGIQENGNLKLDFVSAIDLDGNNIPTTKQGFMSGEYRFAEQGNRGIQNFLDAAKRAGVPISNSSGGGGSTTMVCDNDICIITYSN